MALSRTQRLRPVVDVAQRREAAAARRLGALNRSLAQCEQRLAELEGYRRQYRDGFLSTGRGGLDAVRLKDYQVFLAKLDQAVAQARAQVEAARRECERQRGVWLETRTRCLALDKVGARFAAEERRVEARAEQRRMDEHAQQVDARAGRARAEEGEEGR